MNLNPLALLETAINEHGSATILKERLALATDQFAAIDRKNVELLAQLEDIKLKNGVLDSENRRLHLELQKLTTPKTRQQPIRQRPADMCPFCRHATGELTDIKPHEIHGMNGLKVGFYQCSECGKKYDHIME